MLLFIAGLFLGSLATWYWGILPRDRFPMTYYHIDGTLIRRKRSE